LRLQILDFNKAYIVLPILATEETTGEGPILSLSKQILVTRDSDPTTISNFLFNQIEIACMNYGIDNLGNYTVVLKFRPIVFKDEVIKSIPKINFNIKEKHIKRNVSLMNSKFYNGSILPLSMNLDVYGDKLNKFLSAYYILKFDLDPNGIFFKKDEFVIYVKIDGTKHGGILFKDKAIFLKFEDILIEGNNFIRTIDKYIIFIDNFSISHFDKITTNSFITSSKSNAKLNTNIVTFDIETYVKDGKFVPFACGWFDGEFMRNYYLTDFNSPYEMLLQALRDLLDFNPNAKVYIHNFANFDYIFLIKVLFENFVVKPYFKDNKVLNLTYHTKDNSNIKIDIYDSYLILPSSLRTLASKYKVEVQKGIFPHNFVNENNLDYIGITPDITLFNDISAEEYEGLISDKWNLKEELIKYCEIDCISLYQIIFKFNELIYGLFSINIHRYPTLSSLAFAIYRSKFMPTNVIAQLSGQMAKDIRQSYTGGACDMYIPSNKEEKIYAYDVNSLYPSIMKDCDMPVGNPTFFEGDIRLINPDAFGFFYCNIIAPDNLEHPILQTHIQTENGIRTMAPLGTWSDMIFSAEMDNAMKFGYKFEILWGYTFEKGKIFKEYIETLYELRLNYPKSNPLNYTAKLLMNSVYGRFGMDDNFPDITIFDNQKEYLTFEINHSEEILDIIELDNKILVKHKNFQKEINTMLDGVKETHNTNVAIASAITGYARIHMSQFKNTKDFNLFYTDTDSIYINKPLPDDLISDKTLGLMKLENTINKAIFLSPKVYCLLTEDNNLIYKVKGLSHDVELTMKDFDNLLYEHSLLEKLQTKWRRNLSLGQVSILDQLYTLKVTNNKRKLIYDNNKLIGTSPFIINNKEIINND